MKILEQSDAIDKVGDLDCSGIRLRSVAFKLASETLSLGFANLSLLCCEHKIVMQFVSSN